MKASTLKITMGYASLAILVSIICGQSVEASMAGAVVMMTAPLPLLVAMFRNIQAF